MNADQKNSSDFEHPSSAIKLHVAYQALQDGRFNAAHSDFLILSKEGLPFANLYLGYMYLVGSGVLQSTTEAKKYFLLAANGNIDSAKYNLGLLLQKERDFKEAEKWFRNAANNGHAAAMYEVFRLSYLANKTINQNKGALDFLEKSSSNQFPMAMRDLLKLELNFKFGLARFGKALVSAPFRLVQIFLLMLKREGDPTLKKLN